LGYQVYPDNNNRDELDTMSNVAAMGNGEAVYEEQCDNGVVCCLLVPMLVIIWILFFVGSCFHHKFG
jgi:hypothetical protein